MKKLPIILLLAALLTGCGTLHAAPEPTPSPTPSPEPPRQAESEPLTIFWQGDAYEGVFSGTADGDVPLSGSFTAPELTFTGTFSDGAPDTGSLTGDGVFAAFEGERCIGHYEGGMEAGALSGEAVFTGRTESGIPMTYSGAFSGGLANGEGVLTYTDESRFDLIGTFTDGLHTPSGADALRSLGTRKPCFELTEEQEIFLADYPGVWDAGISHWGFFDTELPLLTEGQYPIYQLFRDRVPPVAWMEELGMRVVDWRYETINARGDTYTVITLSSNDYYENVVTLVIPETMDGLRYGLRLHAAALPIQFSTYVTVQGLERECLVELGASVYY